MMISDRATQRMQIQEIIDEYFERHIDISPRAMAALQGRWCDKDIEKDLPDFIPSLSIFEGLISSSPGCLLLLSEAIISTEVLFSRDIEDEPAPLFFATLESIFEGNPAPYYWGELCPSGVEIKRKGTLTELDLFSAFLETAYNGPKFFFENVDSGMVAKYCTDVGDRLLKAASINPTSVIENYNKKWDESVQREFDKEFGDRFLNYSSDYYVARGLAEKFFNTLNRRIGEILIADPSHDRFQFALWQDGKGVTHLSPFGVGKLGSLTLPHLEKGDFVLREGIFQPLSAILPGYKDDTIYQLEEMINSKSASEGDFQSFFKVNQELLSGIDYKTIHPQLVLYSDESPDLIPDFMLEPMSSKFCDLLELKLPYQSLVSCQL